MGIVEDRASGDGELVVTVFAVEQLLVGLQFNDRHLAARAFGTGRPAQAHKQLAALIVSSKQGVYIN